jgi:hypothetical protein
LLLGRKMDRARPPVRACKVKKICSGWCLLLTRLPITLSKTCV